MLTTLRIKNLALVADLTLELQPGFNAITGETGAGKSVLLGALSLVLGERADRTLLRSGCEICTVEAVFDVHRLKAPLAALLETNGLEPCEDGQLVLKRSFTAAGANRQFVNGSPAVLATLAALGEWLVDIHGPHDHQSLLHPAKQLALLDAFGRLEKTQAAFGDLVRRHAGLEADKAALGVDEAIYAQQLDLLRFQVQEITAARLDPGEAELLENDYRRASNAAQLLELTQAALNALSEDDSALLTQAGRLGRIVQELVRLDPAASPILDLHQQAFSALGDLQSALAGSAEKTELDPDRLRALEERLNLLQSLKRKYGATLAEAIAFGESARQKWQRLEQRDAELGQINAALAQLEVELDRAGLALTKARRQILPKLSQAVAGQLQALGFNQSQFDVQMTTLPPAERRSRPLTGQGFDTVEFQFAPNIGEPARPLRAIASSGEIARVMLALKTVLADQDEIPVLIFDEVDANVGGETAEAVGEKMRQLGRHRQVLCVTHLASVAARAAAHYQVSKQVQADRTLTEIRLLDPAERVTELARMLGGQSETARRHAQALLKGAAPIRPLKS